MKSFHPILSSLLLFPFLVITQQSTAQRAKNWINKIEYDHYTEGVYSLQVGSNVVEIISLTGYFEPYSFNKNERIHIDFYSPDSVPYLVKAEEKKINKYYWMESHPANSQKKWNTFGPWSTDGLLKQLSVQPQDLAILIHLEADDSQKFSPAIVYMGNRPDRILGYRAYFRLGVNISGGSYKVFRGDFENQLALEGALVQEGPILKRLGGSTFPIQIKQSSLVGYTGYVTCQLTLHEDNRVVSKPIFYSFKFYHKAL